MRTSKFFTFKNIDIFKIQLLNWAQQYKKIVWLDSNNPNENNSPYNLSEFDAVLAVELKSEFQCDCEDSFELLKEYQEKTKDYIFGYLSYDLKNDIEDLSSNNHDGLHFPDLFFFQPKKLFFIKDNQVEVKYLNTIANDIDADIKTIENTSYTVGLPEQCVVETT